MLEHLDTFVAFGAVMFGVSLFVTAITQFISSLLQSRGKELALGLERLFQYVAPELDARAHAVAHAIALHPLISDSVTGANGRAKRLASAVREDEVKRLLLGKSFWAEAARLYVEQRLQGQTAMLDALSRVSSEAWLRHWQAARALATATGATLTSAGAALEGLLGDALGDAFATQVMRELGASLAPFMEAERDAKSVAKRVGEWFKSAMDRTSQRFAQRMRIITVVVSALLALIIRFDSFALLHQLSKDPELRGRISAQMDNLNREYEKTSGDAAAKDLAARLDSLKATTRDLKALDFELVPSEWRLPHSVEWPGVLASMVLLSLGAPFWFNLLRQMSNLRPVVANLEHEERRGQAEKGKAKGQDGAKSEDAEA